MSARPGSAEISFRRRDRTCLNGVAAAFLAESAALRREVVLVRAICQALNSQARDLENLRFVLSERFALELSDYSVRA